MELGTYGQYGAMGIFGRQLHGYVGTARNPYVALKHYKDRMRAGGTANFRGGKRKEDGEPRPRPLDLGG